MRKVIFTNEEYYHIYNRGVDKRVIFENKYDYARFIESMFEFNIDKSIGSLYKKRLKNKNDLTANLQKNNEKLVEIVAYCLNPNHYHLLLKQVGDGGVSKFMHKIGTGYTNYFNEKKERSGSLFQGSFKAVWIDSNEYLLNLSAYINKNHYIHYGKNNEEKGWVYSSELDYTGKRNEKLCKKNIILEQFNSKKEYMVFMNKIALHIKEMRDIDSYLLEKEEINKS